MACSFISYKIKVFFLAQKCLVFFNIYVFMSKKYIIRNKPSKGKRR